MSDLKKIQFLRTQGYIGGEWLESGRRFGVKDPATGELLADVADVGLEGANLAIDAASAAFPTWSRLPAKERSLLLRRWAALMQDNTSELAAIMTAEQGKPLTEAVGEVAYAASYLEWYAEEARRTYGEVIPSPHTDRRLLTVLQPVGVCSAITPWNFPMAMVTRKVGPALAAGCTMVLKPAEETPLSALALASLSQMAGVPAGVFNVVTTMDASAVGTAFCQDPRVSKLSFTGSTAVGKLLYAQCASTVKKLSLELGGNAPLIVFDDADLEAAVEGAVASKFRNAGQTCVCANRIFVQSGIYAAFLERLSRVVEALRVGPGTADRVIIGPVINEGAIDKLDGLVADAIGLGACLVVGGGREERAGTFFQPTIITDLTSDMRVAREEIFGPVAAIWRFETEEEVICRANDTRAGLASYLFSRDLGRVWRVAEALECGMVGVNTGILSSEVAPFGGVKESGFGREGGRQGILDYLDTKYICMAGL